VAAVQHSLMQRLQLRLNFNSIQCMKHNIYVWRASTVTRLLVTLCHDDITASFVYAMKYVIITAVNNNGRTITVASHCWDSPHYMLCTRSTTVETNL